MSSESDSIYDGDRDDPTIFNPNLTINDGKHYLITKRYERFNDDNNDDNQDESIALDLEAEELDFTHCRIATIKNFDVLSKTIVLGLRNNLITKIEGLNRLTMLQELELYDNQITLIENLDCLENLRSVICSYLLCSQTDFF